MVFEPFPAKKNGIFYEVTHAAINPHIYANWPVSSEVKTVYSDKYVSFDFKLSAIEIGDVTKIVFNEDKPALGFI